MTLLVTPASVAIVATVTATSVATALAAGSTDGARRACSHARMIACRMKKLRS